MGSSLGIGQNIFVQTCCVSVVFSYMDSRPLGDCVVMKAFANIINLVNKLITITFRSLYIFLAPSDPYRYRCLSVFMSVGWFVCHFQFSAHQGNRAYNSYRSMTSLYYFFPRFCLVYLIESLLFMYI